MMIDGKFTAKERAYLASLPAVKSVSASHIRYTDQFRVECMCRYDAGESPTSIFREAGLDPKLIGYKRVERCISRWKRRQAKKAKSGKQTDSYAFDADGLQVLEHKDLTQPEWGASNADDPEDGLSQMAKAQLAINERDLLIARQALRIDELERVLRQLVIK
ncbi:HTH domain-containing protein [Bifidobacterium moukalabense]|nr:HTH domain-containing protein [Bifidobacterium moukalabense]